MIAGTLRRAAGTAVILGHLRSQAAATHAGADRIAARRDQRLRSTLRWAARTVPHYRDLFARLGIDPATVVSVDELARLPLLSKDEVRADPERFVSTARRARGGITLETSGTTGTRLAIRHDAISLLANIAYSERERRVVVDLLGGAQGYRELSIVYRGSTLRRIDDFYARHSFRPGRPDRRFVAVEEPLEAVVAAINEHRPDVLGSYGSYLETLFRVAAARGLEVHRPRVLRYGADAMSPDGKTFLERELGIPVVSQYNAVEALKIGFTCAAGAGFHLHADLCHVRIVDSSGRDAPRGETGEIVLSNLVNRGTVLLNYRLGDLGALSEQSCPCGRTLPLLTELRGRVEDVLQTANGGLVHPRVLWGAVKKHPAVIRYQLVEREPGRFELSLMTTTRDAYDRDAAVLGRALSDLLEGAPIATRYSPELGVREAAKFRPVVPYRRGREEA
jgi:phenylacetate-CoA ligase